MTAGTGKAPDYPQTRLALRSWRLDRAAMMVRSLNAPVGSKPSWIAKAMASPAGNWPYGKPLEATCVLSARKPKDGEEPHGPVPATDCTCGVYATTDLEVINGYLGHYAPILGVVELGGRIIPATQGYRARGARVAAILLVDEALTEPWHLLRELAEAYRVPAVVPHSARPEDFRLLTQMEKAVVTDDELTRVFGGNR